MVFPLIVLIFIYLLFLNLRFLWRHSFDSVAEETLEEGRPCLVVEICMDSLSMLRQYRLVPHILIVHPSSLAVPHSNYHLYLLLICV
jgi:hypothetical protein